MNRLRQLLHLLLFLFAGQLAQAQGNKPYLGRQVDALLTKKSDYVQSAATLPAYSGGATQVVLPDGRPYKRVTSSATVDGVTCLSIAGSSSERWMLTLQKITPQHFGAVGDGVTDDGPALLKWLTTPGLYQLDMGAGTYKSSIALPRTNLGACVLTGAGSAKTKIVFTGDTDGLSIVNPLNGNYGIIVVSGIEIISGGTKSATREALILTSQHEQRPGIVANDISVKSLVSGQEWGVGIHIHDSSETSLMNIDIQGFSLDVMTGLKITASSGRPSVEHNVSHINMRAMNTGIAISSTGYPGVEGVKINVGGVIACTKGIDVRTAYPAPDFTVNGFHINCVGGEALYFDGPSQIALSNCLIYVYKSATVTPGRAVYMKNTQIATSTNIIIDLFDNIPYGIELAGSGQAVDLSAQIICNYGASIGMYVPVGYSNCHPNINRIWAGTNGPNVGAPVVDLAGNTVIPLEITVPTTGADPNSPVFYNPVTGQFGITDRYVGVGLKQQVVTTSTTVDPSRNNFFIVINGSNPITIAIDKTKLIPGQPLYFKRFGVSNPGVITIQTSDPANNFMQQADLSFTQSFVLPNTVGTGAVAFAFDGNHMELLSTISQGSLANAVQGDFPISRAKYITAITSDLPSGFYTLQSSTNVPADPTGFNIWLVTVNRYENNAGTASPWRGIELMNVKSKLMYYGGWDDQSGALLPWQKVHDNRWFPVKETMSPTANQFLYYNSTNAQWENYTPVATYTTPTIGAGGVGLTAGQIIAGDETLPAGSCNPGDIVTFYRLGGQSTMPIEIEVRMQVLEVDKVRRYIHNTATTSKTFIGSQYVMKITKIN